MSLSDSSKRTIRTAVHAVLGGLVAAGTFLPSLVSALSGTPWAPQVLILAGAVGAVIALIAAVLNKLEDLGVLPTWLRSEVSVFEAAPVVAAASPTSVTDAGAAAVHDIEAALGKLQHPSAGQS